jgi:hypothetical protein
MKFTTTTRPFLGNQLVGRGAGETDQCGWDQNVRARPRLCPNHHVRGDSKNLWRDIEPGCAKPGRAASLDTDR